MRSLIVLSLLVVFSLPVAAQAPAPETAPPAPSAEVQTPAPALEQAPPLAAGPTPPPLAAEPEAFRRPTPPPSDEPDALQVPLPAPGPDAAEPVLPAPPQLKIEIPGGTSMRFGLLWQLGYEAHGNSTNDGVTQNLFIRRFSICLGGTVLNQLEYFIDTDFADLMKAAVDTSVKNGPGISIKDAFATYVGLGDFFKVDGGLLMPAVSHNVLQGGGTQYSWDFFFNTFRHSAVFNAGANTFGRDLGVQARGLLARGLLEYRLGVFQGLRDAPVTGPDSKPGSRNPFRVTGRIQLNLLDPETGFFYAGTYLGSKRILSFGVSYDHQPVQGTDYNSLGVDGILDLPVGPGGVTAQVDLLYRDGGDLVVLPKQTAIMGEVGYRFDAVRLSPIVRAERRWAAGTSLDETDLSGGVAFWAFGHTSNLKAFYTRIIPGGAVRAYDQLNAQWQVCFY
jgi:hypothetical protein